MMKTSLLLLVAATFCANQVSALKNLGKIEEVRALLRARDSTRALSSASEFPFNSLYEYGVNIGNSEFSENCGDSSDHHWEFRWADSDGNMYSTQKAKPINLACALIGNTKPKSFKKVKAKQVDYKKVGLIVDDAVFEEPIGESEMLLFKQVRNVTHLANPDVLDADSVTTVKWGTDATFTKTESTSVTNSINIAVGVELEVGITATKGEFSVDLSKQKDYSQTTGSEVAVSFSRTYSEPSCELLFYNITQHSDVVPWTADIHFKGFYFRWYHNGDDTWYLVDNDSTYYKAQASGFSLQNPALKVNEGVCSFKVAQNENGQYSCDWTAQINECPDWVLQEQKELNQ